MQRKSPKTIRVEEPIYPNQIAYFGLVKPWILPGRYEVIREFDKTHWLIRLSVSNITLIRKIDCKTVDFTHQVC